MSRGIHGEHTRNALAQFVHDGAAALEYLPATQSAQTEAVDPDCLPAAQFVHTVREDCPVNLPPTQFLHATACASLYLPGVHESQTVRPVTRATFPISHSVQAVVVVVGANLPTKQGRGEEAVKEVTKVYLEHMKYM